MNILVDGQVLDTGEINRGIGVYFKHVLCNMIKKSCGNVWYITVGNRSSITKIKDPWVETRIHPLDDPFFKPSSDYKRTEKYTECINKIVDEYDIDCFWISSPLMPNVLFLDGKVNCRVYVTVHDLIPYVLPQESIEWGNEINGEYIRRIRYLKNVTPICISRSTGRDLEKILNMKIGYEVIPQGSDIGRFYKEIKEKPAEREISIVYTGGYTYRKNMQSAIEAFSIANKKLSDKKMILYLICNLPDDIKEEYEEKLSQMGIEDVVVLTGYVTDERLAKYYQDADVFFFPSLYEGFGLPIIEAMMAGTYVLAADNSSIPEVCGSHALLCNASDVNDMADKLIEAINNSIAEGKEKKRKRQEYAMQYSWENTADKTYTLLRNKSDVQIEKKQRVAMVTPWPEQKTGIAYYVYKMMPYLSRYYDIDIYTDFTIDSQKLLDNKWGGMYSIEELGKHIRDYYKIVYQIGNNAEFHKGVYLQFIKYGGIAELHEYVIHSFMYDAFFLHGDKEIYGKALENGYGEAGAEYYGTVLNERIRVDEDRYPMSHSVASLAEKTIVHNEWSYTKLGNEFKKSLIPHPCFEIEAIDKKEKEKASNRIEKLLGDSSEECIIGVFGWLNDNKRPYLVLSAIRQLIKNGKKVKMVFWGECRDDSIKEMIRMKHLEDKVIISDYLTRAEYIYAMEKTDIVICLRYPSKGESSGVLAEALKCSKDVIVNGIGQYNEFPDDVCWKVPLDKDEEEILVAMLEYLIDHPDVREQLGKNALEYADKVLNPASIAELYYEAIG